MKEMKMHYEAPELAEIKLISVVLDATAESSGGLPPGPNGDNPF